VEENEDRKIKEDGNEEKRRKERKERKIKLTFLKIT